MLLRYIGETAAATASAKCFGPRASSTTFDCPVILEAPKSPFDATTYHGVNFGEMR